MQFITVHQHNHEFDSVTIHFLQWTGNERELVHLWRIIQDANDIKEVPTNDDYSQFQCKIILISEATVNEMNRIDYGSESYTFEKHTGRFIAPHIPYSRDPQMAHDVLNECYHINGFNNRFNEFTKTD